MSELHILNVGRADCSILLLDTEEGRKTVVLDGGGVCFLGRRPLLEFLEARGIGEIDLLILTHLHQDHFGGFYQLIDRIFVKQLVAPCGDLVFCEKVYPVFGDDEYYREYHAAFRYFEQAGTELLPSAGCGEFSFGESRLRCLYPEAGASMPSVTYARELCRRDLTDAEMDGTLDTVGISFISELVVFNTWGRLLCAILAVYFGQLCLCGALTGRRRTLADAAMTASALLDCVLVALSAAGKILLYDALFPWKLSQLVFCLLFNMGTSVDLVTLRREWRTVVGAIIGMAAAIVGCCVAIPIIGKDFALAADVRRPPGQARHAGVEAGSDLLAHGAEVALDVARPHQRAVALAARPAAADP